MDDQEVVLLSSDSGTSPLYESNLNNDEAQGTEFDVNDYNIQNEQRSQKMFDILPNKSKSGNDYRNLTKQKRLAHILSDTDDSDNSFSKPNSNEYDQPSIPHILSESEDSDRNTSVRPSVSQLKYNGNKRTVPTNLLSLDIHKCQDLNEEVSFNPQSPEKKKRKTVKKTNVNEKAKDDKLKKKEEEAKKRAERQAVLKIQKQLKPGECIKYMKVLLDSALLACPFGGDLLASVQNMDCEYQMNTQVIPLSITWLRQIPDSNPVEEPQMILVWQWEQFVQSVRDHTLCDDIRSIRQKLSGKTITLVVYSLDGYFSYLKNKRRKSQTRTRRKDTTSDLLKTVTRGEMELALTELQIQLNCSHRLVNTSQELGLLVSQFTKSIAEIPFKKDKQKREQENLDWFAVGDSRDCVRIDKEGNGLLRLWQQQLCQFNLATIDTSQAIASVYPSPQVLIQAYDKCTTQKEGELLLQNIQVRRCQGPLAPARRIGPEMSKKIYMFFNNVDGDCPLSQE